jgi:uncharacterized protein HemX
MDTQRFLSDEPVLACPPSAAYRLRKFVKRHKGRVAAANLVLVALFLGMAGTTFGLVRAESQRRQAVAAEAKKGSGTVTIEIRCHIMFAGTAKK